MSYFKKNILKISTTIVMIMLLVFSVGCGNKTNNEKEDNNTKVNEDKSSVVSKGVNLDDLGNIANGQYYFDDGTNQYYSSFDKNSVAHIYQTNKDGTTKIIFNGFGWSFVVRDGWLYFSGNEGASIDATYNLFRMKLDGSNLEHLNNNFCYNMHFYDKWLYYMKKSSWGALTSDIYRSSVDGKNEELVISEIGGLSIVYEEKLYYLGADGYIYNANPDGTNKKQVLSETVKTFIIGQGKIIYVDNSFNIKTSEIDGSGIKTIRNSSGKEIADMNSYQDVIFFVEYSSALFDYTKYAYPYELYSIKIDGSDETKVYESESWGFYINAVKNKLYVLDYANDATTGKITAVAKNMDFNGTGVNELYR